ncbi:50S ribosomal protein L3 [Patescibacteria group bacterium]|jgi:large subunit ribosomal protein L3|uniref:50S ribosomal protein L3 n=1 Tax=candidate division WWE3 bacterium TaxID=2053526 RepID=A0A928Y4P9_UNCKA|nr:50S ribosomal protein L3 [candidate division WWE3 bacterium]MCL4732753.1 50S ribosomal protein L3 [Patescibacteria group bacterium]MDL1952929.1 50S ribosomal protein L3 [Candidatus Uhrbacteria bacterium UHB]RIL00649.1 MAG: 50S ribosomal protein L3 [Candidatus Uhrbacteria bacterium]
MKFILGKKLEMSQVYRPDGTVVPVTLVKAGPCIVTQVKTEETDGYEAVQLGFLPKRNLSKPQKGHVKDLEPVGLLREFRLTKGGADMKRGDKVEAAVFVSGDRIHVTGISKGRGFQGVVKRHGFHGQKASHGHKDQERMPGSISAGGVQHVFKGLRMAGRMGDEQVTVKNLEVMEVRNDGIIAVKGAIPGSRNSIVEIVSA